MQKFSDLIHNTSPPSYRLPASDALYGSSDIAYILKHAFPGVFPQFGNKGGVTQASYYETEYAVIFPPCSDKADSQDSQLESIETILKQNRPHLESRLEELKNKQWLFPIAEEQNLFGRPRNHWVTLCYKPKTGEITLIDSTGAGGDLEQIAGRLNIVGGWIRRLASQIEQATKSYVYPTSSMQNMLIDGLAPYSLKPKPIKIVYKEVQIDNIHCGRWTTIILMSLAFGKEPTLSMDDLPNILAYFEKFDQTTFIPYETLEERNNNLTTVSAEKSDSTKTDNPNIASSGGLLLNESPLEVITHGVEQVGNSTTTMLTGREPPTYANHDHGKRGFEGQYSSVSSTRFSISLSSASLYKAFSRIYPSFITSFKPRLTSVSSFSNFLRPTTPIYIPRHIPTNRLSVAAPHSNEKVDGSTTTISISRYILSAQHILSSGEKLLNINSKTYLVKKPKRIRDGVASNESGLKLADVHSHEHDHKHTDERDHEQDNQHTKNNKPRASKKNGLLSAPAVLRKASPLPVSSRSLPSVAIPKLFRAIFFLPSSQLRLLQQKNYMFPISRYMLSTQHISSSGAELLDINSETSRRKKPNHIKDNVAFNQSELMLADEHNHEHDHEQRQNISGSNVTTSTHTSSATAPQTDSAHHSTKYAINPSFKRVPSSTNVNQHPFFTPPNSALLKPINKPSHSHSYFSNHFRLRCLQALFITSAITFTVLAVLLSPSVAIIGAGLTAGLIAALCYSALGTAFMIGVSAAGLEVLDVYEQHMQRSQENFGTKPLAPF